MPEEKEKIEPEAPVESEPEVITPDRQEIVVPEAHELQQAPKMELSVESLIAQAITNGTPVDTMERLLAMRREIRAEQAKEAFDEAMANFQRECPVIIKDKEVKEKDGKTVRYKFAPLDSIVEQTKEYIAKNGLSYAIQVRQTDKMLTVVCIVKHKLGHSEESALGIPIGSEQFMSEVQKYGARVTFAKRYAFCNAFGIMTGDDDTDAVDVPDKTPQNGQRGNYSQRPSNRPQTPQNSAPKEATDEQRRKIFALGRDLGQTPEGTKEGVKKVLKLDSFTSLTFDDAARMIRALDKKVKSLPPKEKEIVTGENAEEIVKEVFEVEENSEVITGDNQNGSSIPKIK